MGKANLWSLFSYCIWRVNYEAIRRTVKTLMGKAGIDKQLRDRIQNHALQDVSSRHYDRYDYLAEKRQGMKVWNDYLELIINPDKKVTRIAGKRA